MPFTIQDNDEALAPTPQSTWMQTDINALVAGIGGGGVISGCLVTAQGSPDMTVAVAAGQIRIGGTLADVAAGNVAITTADGANPRVDLVVVSSTGTKSVTAGTAATSPKAPDIPASSVLLAMVYVPAADTTIAANQITDKRVVLGVVATMVNLRDYGADPTGTNASDTALDSAVAALPADGGTIFVPPGKYKLGSTHTFTKEVGFLGVGTSGADRDVDFNLAARSMSVFFWAGAAAPMFVYNSGSRPLFGLQFRNIALDGQGIATIGLKLDRVRASHFDNIRIADCVTNCLWLGTSSATANDNTHMNTFTNMFLERCPTPLYLSGNTGHTANSCHNAFDRLTVDFDGDPGIDLNDCDNNTFVSVFCYRRTGSGYSVRFRADARSNYFFHLQADGGVRAHAPNAAAYANVIVGYDRENGQPAPTLESGANLTWTEDGTGSVGWQLANRLRIAPPGQVLDNSARLQIASLNSDHIKLAYGTDSHTFRIYVDNARRLFFEKDAGAVGSDNTQFLFRTIGGLDSITPFWSGAQFGGHSVTRIGAAQFPTLTIFSRSALGADPTDYEFAVAVSNMTALVNAIAFIAQNNTGSWVRFGFGDGAVTVEAFRAYYDGTNALVGINKAIPTALLHIGTTGTLGHIRMDGIAGNPASPAAGDHWYNLTQKAHRAQMAAGTIGLAGLLKAQTTIAGGDTINTSAAEVNFATNFQFPANSLTVGKVLRVFACGTYGTLGSGTVSLNLKLKFGTVVLVNSGVITTAVSIAARYWEINAYLTVISVGASGTIECRGTVRVPTANTDVGFSLFGGGSLATVDTTAAQTLQISAQHGASSASNTIVMRELVVEVMD